MSRMPADAESIDRRIADLHARGAASAPPVAPEEWRTVWAAISSGTAAQRPLAAFFGRPFRRIAAAAAVLLVSSLAVLPALLGGAHPSGAAGKAATSATGDVGGARSGDEGTPLAIARAGLGPILGFNGGAGANACTVEFVSAGEGYAPRVIYPESDADAVVILLNRES